MALVVFDPFLSSRPLAAALLRSPDGKLITEGHYYPFSSVFFYTNRSALLLNGRRANLEYGSNAPGAPDVFIDESQFENFWQKPERYYVVASGDELAHFEAIAGPSQTTLVATSGGKLVLTNHPLASSKFELSPPDQRERADRSRCCGLPQGNRPTDARF